MELRYAMIRAPLASLLAVCSDRGLCQLRFLRGAEARAAKRLLPDGARRVEAADEPVLGQLAAELARYFAGEAVRFRARLDLSAGTAFQRRVWHALRRVPFGRTIGYGELAARVGSPRAARAVGQAMGANPVPIVVPCHRVIRSDGALGGFGAGLPIKRWLLRHERAVRQPSP